jgi:hypothetical protein
MAHTSRCGQSTQPLEKCRCSCAGSLHGSAQHSSAAGGSGPAEPTTAPTAQQLHDRTPAGQQALRNAIAASPDPNAPAVDPLRTRLYLARKAELEAAAANGSAAENFAEALKGAREPDGGFTIDPRTGAAEAAGFFVSVHPELEQAVPVQELRPKDLQRYVNERHEVLREEGNYFGAWHDPETGVVSLDVSSKTEAAEAARVLAAEHAQVAFFDAQTFESVEVDSTQRNRIAELMDRSEDQ